MIEGKIFVQNSRLILFLKDDFSVDFLSCLIFNWLCSSIRIISSCRVWSPTHLGDSSLSVAQRPRGAFEMHLSHSHHRFIISFLYFFQITTIAKQSVLSTRRGAFFCSPEHEWENFQKSEMNKYPPQKGKMKKNSNVSGHQKSVFLFWPKQNFLFKKFRENGVIF